jgi:hypothetical protein
MRERIIAPERTIDAVRDALTAAHHSNGSSFRAAPNRCALFDARASCVMQTRFDVTATRSAVKLLNGEATRD